ncbi:hypothetical protein HanRHA438_Chr14g0637101 [Helianthus annuus]|nr:hypothetical protein HanRHA438_Chr14g0637101 [Helianthus annuus]
MITTTEVYDLGLTLDITRKVTRCDATGARFLFMSAVHICYEYSNMYATNVKE